MGCCNNWLQTQHHPEKGCLQLSLAYTYTNLKNGFVLYMYSSPLFYTSMRVRDNLDAMGCLWFGVVAAAFRVLPVANFLR
jgi:hypothetical protein